MTNCEKCGNPLQPGLTTCPICGTTAKSIDNPSAPVMQAAPTETLGETPVANPAPQVQTPAAPVLEPGPIVATPAPAPVVEAPVASPASIPAAPAAPAAPVPTPAPQTAVPAPAPSPAEPVVEVQIAPAPAPTAPMAEPTPMAPTPAPVVEAPVASVPIVATPTIDPLPAQGFSGAEAAPIAPAPVVEPATPTPAPQPAQPADLTTPVPVAQEVPTDKNKNSNKKPKGNIGVIAIVAIVALALGLGIGYLLSPSLKAAPVETPTDVVSKTQTVTLNGFTFAVEENWQYSQLGDKVVVNKDDESVLARIAIYEGVFENMNTTNIELTLSTKEGYSDIEVEKTKLGERDVILVNAVNGESSIQYYYVAYSTEKVISITVIYANKEDKADYEEAIEKLVESTTYSEDVVNALEAISPYSGLFDDGKVVYDSSFTEEKTTQDGTTTVDPNTQTTPETIS